MSHYAIYIWSSYLFAFCLLGLQGVFAFLAWQKYLHLVKGKYVQ